MLPVTRLRVGRVVLLAVVTFAALIGGTMWLLTTKARPFLTSPVDSTAWPASYRTAIFGISTKVYSRGR